MKKRNAVILAGALAAGLACAPVQAKTFAIYLEGKTYYVTIQNGEAASSENADLSATADLSGAADGAAETEVAVNYLEVSDDTETAKDTGVTVQTQSEVTVVLPDNEDAATFSYEVEPKDGNTVTYRYLTDSDGEDAVTYRVVTEPEEGTLTYQYVTDPDNEGAVTYRVVTEPEEGTLTYQYVTDSDGEGAVTYRVVTEPEVEDTASVTGRYVAVEGGEETASDWYMTITDEDGNVVAELPKEALEEEEDDLTYLQLEDDGAVEQAYSVVFTDDSREAADGQERIEEYEKAGITQDDSGAWIFNDKKVTWLVDEDGGIYMNNFEKDKEKRCYVVIKRDEDGNITDVVDVSLEEAVKSALETS